MSINRRDLVKAGFLSLPFAGMSRQLAAITNAANRQPGGLGSKRVLTIYLRGGWDGLHVLFPLADRGYYYTRPGLSFDRPGATGVGARPSAPVTGYPALGMNPSFADIARIDASKVAYLMNVGNTENAERSHFTEQHVSETGRAVYGASDSGWIPQLYGAGMGNSVLGTPVSISKRKMLQYRTTRTVDGPDALHLQTPYSVASGLQAPRDLQIGYGIGSPEATRVRDAVLNTVQASGTPAYLNSGDGVLLRDSVVDASLSLGTLRQQLQSFGHDPNFPVPGDSLPAGSALTQSDVDRYGDFFAHLEEAVELLKISGTGDPYSNAVGLELGGWDTHFNQDASMAQKLRVLSHALWAASKALEDDQTANGGDWLIHVVSEFGRTVAENGAAGTDHGVGGLNLAIGSTVNGGVYNMWQSHWTPPLAPFANNGAKWTNLLTQLNNFDDALEPATDFRITLIEIAEKFFGIAPANIPNLAGVGADWDAIRNNGLPTSTPLNFLS